MKWACCLIAIFTILSTNNVLSSDQVNTFKEPIPFMKSGKFYIRDMGNPNLWFKNNDGISRPAVGDFDNDGRNDDIIYFGLCSENSSNCIRGHYFNSRYHSFKTVGLTTDIYNLGNQPVHKPLVGDFDNDGFLDDVVQIARCGSRGNKCLRTFFGNGETLSNAHGYYPTGGAIWTFNNDNISSPVVGDFDGDNFVDDIAYLGKCGKEAKKCIRIHLRENNNFKTVSYSVNTWFATNDPISTPFVGDFDNDGVKDDIGYYGKCGPSGVPCWRVHLKQTDKFITKNFTTGSSKIWFDDSDPRSIPVVGDFDGDSFSDDLIHFGLCGTGEKCWRAYIGDGSSFKVENYGGQQWFGYDSADDFSHAPIVGNFYSQKYSEILYKGSCGNDHRCVRGHIRLEDEQPPVNCPPQTPPRPPQTPPPQ